VRFGSALETTTSAGISSPLASTTPETAPFLVETRVTSAFVRISAPKPSAAFASACVSAPIPPRTNVAGPAALSSKADWTISPRLVPADQGPANAPKIPRAATRRAEQLRLEELGDEVRDGHRSPAQQPERVATRQAAELAADAEELPELAERRVVDRGRRHRDERTEHAADAAEALVERELARASCLETGSSSRAVRAASP
jgi:hypothetical protein